MKNFDRTQPTRNILVAVDVQNDFIEGSLAVTEGEQVVQPINDVATAVRNTGGTTVFTRDWHPATTPHFDNWPVHCVAGSDGAAFHPALDIQPNDTIISKGTGQSDGYSGWEGFSDDGTNLETLITPRERYEKVRVFIGGLATDYCVKATAIDIAEHFSDDDRVRVYLLRDAIRAVGLAPHDEADALAMITAAQVAAIDTVQAQRLIEEVLS